MAEIIMKALAAIDNADLEDADAPYGGFTAVLSTPDTDRDGDRLERNEWKSLPARIPIDVDHGMSVATTVGSGEPYWDDASNQMMIKVAFSSIPRAQETRTLVREKHIGHMSVAFLTDKSQKSGTPRRELLNAGIVAIPANKDAVILSAKEFHALTEAKATGNADGESPVGEITTKASQAEGSLVQGIHDAAAHLGAVCAGAEPTEAEPDPGDGSDDGANKSAKDNTITITVKPELDIDEFRKQLDALMSTKSSGVEPDSPQDDDSAPTDAASEAASGKEPADDPADAAVDDSDEVAKQLNGLLAELLLSELDIAELDA